ncbi:MAG: ClpX C4-type zinc finger protein [Candidatus Limnocylindria bacterium]
MSSDDRCSFCGKRREQVAWLVAGQKSVFICDECVRLAAQNFDPPVGIDTGEAARRIIDTLRKPNPPR